MISGNTNYLKSKFDPNYWLFSLDKKDNLNLDNKITNLIQLSLNNEKYRTKSIINYIYYYNKLSEPTKDLIFKINDK